MEQSYTTKKRNTNFSCQEKLSKTIQITEWHNNLIQIPLEKLPFEHENISGNVLNNKTLDCKWNVSEEKGNLLDPIIKERREVTENDVLNALGTEFIFTKISKNVGSIFISRDPLTQMHKKSTIASFFNDEIVYDLSHDIFLRDDGLIKDLKKSYCLDFIKKNFILKKDRVEYYQ